MSAVVPDSTNSKTPDRIPQQPNHIVSFGNNLASLLEEQKKYLQRTTAAEDSKGQSQLDDQVKQGGLHSASESSPIGTILLDWLEKSKGTNALYLALLLPPSPVSVRHILAEQPQLAKEIEYQNLTALH